MIRPRTSLALIVATTALAAACDGPPPTVLDHSTGRSFAGLTQKVHVELDRASPIAVRYWSDGVAPLQVLGSSSTRHDLILTALKAERPYHYEIRVQGQDDPERAVLATGTFGTALLPQGLYELDITAEGTPSVPFTMLALGSERSQSWFVMVDAMGDIVWYMEANGGAAAWTRLGDGRFVLQDANGGLTAVTPDGVPTAVLAQEVMPASTGPGAGTRIHHDVVANSDHSVLYLARTEHVVDDTTWVGEQIREWTPSTGADVLKWDARDFLDPKTDRGPRSQPGDWVHANALNVTPSGNVLVSLHYLDQVISIPRDFSGIEWRLGGPGSTFEVPADARFSGQHTAAEVGPSRVLMFDNGFAREGGELFSRALELELDSDARSARVAWEFRPQPDNFARIISSARRLPNGNTLVGFGTSAGQMETSTGPVEVYEVTPAGDVAWHLVVGGARQVYRATPVESILHEAPFGGS